jgi:hypothetical protein
MLQRTAVGKIDGDACRPKRMIADRRKDAGRGSSPADHAPGIGLHHRLFGQHGRVVPWAGAEQEPLAVLGDTGGVDIGAQRLGERMMARHRVLLTAFLVHLPACALRPQILDLHPQCGGDTREGIGEGGDQRTVAQIADSVGGNAIDQLAPLDTIEHRRLADLHTVLRPAHGGCRIERYHLAGD